MRSDITRGGTFLSDDLWRDLRVATEQHRPDWDTTAPGLRAPWDSGERTAFHGRNSRPLAPTSRRAEP